MLILNTRFFVTSDLTRQVLWDMAVAWWTTSDNYDFPDPDFKFDKEEYKMESADGKQRVIVNNYESRFIIQLITDSETNMCRYDTVFVLDDASEHHVLQLIQDRSLIEMTTADNKGIRVFIPNLLKEIFWNEYGDDDNGIMTDNLPYRFRKNDVDWVVDVLHGAKTYMNPIVYVSVASKMNIPLVDCDKLASELMGQAHVIVEGSPTVSRLIRDKSTVRHPFNGQIGVYLPNGSSRIYTISDTQDNIWSVINGVRKMLSSIDVPAEYDHTKLRQQHLFSKLANSEDKEFVQLCESMISDKDAEIAELKRKLNDAMSKGNTLQSKFDEMKQESDEQDCVKIVVSGEELYEGEMSDVILRVLKKEYDAMTGDPNLSSSRKYDVLGVVLEHNFPHKTDAELRDVIKSSFKDGTVTREGIERLRSLGFVVKKQGNEHYRIYPEHFEKYVCTASCTPSDKARAAKNCASDFYNVLYGY